MDFLSLKLCSPVIKKEDTNSRSLKKKTNKKLMRQKLHKN